MILSGTEGAARLIAEEIAAATPGQRKQMVAAIDQIIEGEFQLTQPSQKSDGIGVIGQCALVLKAVGDENATLEAFGARLPQVASRVGFDAEQVVISALIQCRDPKAVETLADLGRLRLKQAKELGPPLGSAASASDEQKKFADNIVGSLGNVIVGLMLSANSSGRTVARELRDEFVKLIEGSPYQKEFSEGLERLDSYLGEARPRSHAPVVDRIPQAEQPQQSKPKIPATDTQPGQKQGAAGIGTVIVVASVSLMFFGWLIWFLRRK